MNWIEEFIKEYDVCPKAATLLRAGGFVSPQNAWTEWQDGEQMLWLLSKLDALTPEQSALISCLIVRKISGVWRLLSEDSRAAVVATEKWLAGNASLAEVQAAMVAAAWCASAVDASADEDWQSRASKVWAARAVSALVAVDETPLAEEAAEAVAVAASVMSAVEAMWAPVSVSAVEAMAMAEAARREIAEIVREVMPVCPFSTGDSR